jgi:putative membrane protein
MEQYFLWYKSLHVIAVISWMAAIFYLPRLFAYHASVEKGSDSDKIFQLMEVRLLRIIMNPAMIITYISGFMISYIYGIKALGGWFHIKLTCVLLLTIFHGLLAKWRKDFTIGKNKYSSRFYKIVNEIPTILMIIIVIMVIIKPFE